MNQSFPNHPGKILLNHVFEPRGLTIEQLVQDLHVPYQELKDLTEGKSNITSNLAYRLGLYFKVGAEGFLNLQQLYDLECWKRKEKVEAIDKEIQPYQGNFAW